MEIEKNRRGEKIWLGKKKRKGISKSVAEKKKKR